MKCTTYEQLHLEMARVYKMCVGTAFEGKEYLCVKQPSGIFYDQPRFTDSPLSYEFALGIVEDKLVWEGDKLYGTPYGVPMEYTANQSLRMHKRDGGECELSWNPPAPPKPKTVSISVNVGEPVAWRWRWKQEGARWNYSDRKVYEEANMLVEPLYVHKEPIVLVLPDGDDECEHHTFLGRTWRSEVDRTIARKFIYDLLEGKL